MTQITDGARGRPYTAPMFTATEVTRMNANQVIILARKHVGNGAAMESSARLCLTDAVALYDDGKHDDAKARALKSLAYSVGILHADYQRAAK